MKRKATAAAEEVPAIGALIERYYKEKRTFKSALARHLGVLPQTVIDYQKKTSMQTRILWNLSWVLKHNFLKDLADQLPKEFSSYAVKDTTLQDRITALEKENERLQAEVNILQRILER
jgi:uncharacterized small protein (DUF1192 family)